jgi:hypothetical protein
VKWWLLWVLALPCSAAAQSVHLQWTAPVGSMCPNGATLSADVEQLTGQRFVTDLADAEVRVVGRIERGELGVAAQIEAHTADGTPIGTRELRAASEDCASLRRPLAMVLAMLLDQPVPVSRRLPLALGLELVGDTHVLPRTSGGVGLVVSYEPLPWLALRAQGDYWWPVVAETRRGSGARLQGASGALALCPRLVGRSVALWQCIGAQAGALLATPRGLLAEGTKTLAFADLVTELALSWSVTPHTRLWASGGPLFALMRPELYFERADGSPVRIHRASPVGAIFRLALTIGGR